MSNKDVRPAAMVQYWEKRNQAFASMSRTARRVKIEQNHTWKLRILPVEMGKDKEPFVDIAQHWWNKAPITCPKHTPESWGGDPAYPCPICDVSERLMSSNSDEINSIGYRIRCNLRIRSWCIVFDMEDQRGNVEEMPMSEILNPYEFDMYKTTWEYFAKFQKWATTGRRGSAPGSPWGILDLETGCDLLATQGAKGVTLDRCDPGPIFDLNDPNFDTNLQKIWAHLRPPQIVIPSEKQLLEVAVKVEEYAESGGRRRRGREEDDDRGRGRRGRFREEDEDYDDREDSRGRGRVRPHLGGEESYDDRSSLRGRRTGISRGEDDQGQTDQPPEEGSVPAPRPRGPAPAAPAQAGPPAEPLPPPRRTRPVQAEDQPAPVGGASATARRRQAVAEQQAETEAPEQATLPPPRRSTIARRQPEPEPEPQPEAENTGTTAEEAQQDETPAPAPAAPPPARRGIPPAAPLPARRSVAQPATQEEDLGPQRAPTRRTSAAPAATGVDEDEDNAPEERRDPAPLVREAVEEDAPPPVSAPSPMARRKVGDSSDIKARLNRLTEKGR